MLSRSVLRRLVKGVLPASWQSGVQHTLLRLRSLHYAGDAVQCPCCGTRFRTFLPFGVVPRPNAQCGRCGSLERDRLLFLYLKRETDLFSFPHALLHVAPERCLQQILTSSEGIDYLSIDLQSPLADMRVDITDMPFPDDTFDVVICNHVLEHIEADTTAMGELHRVLKPGGWAILQTPVDPRREHSFEDAAIVAPHDRERAFGQYDHVRVYGRDYESRLQAAGFDVDRVPYAESLSVEVIERYGLVSGEPIYRCSKGP